MMKKGFLAASALSLILVSVGSAQGAVSPTEDGDQYTQAQLKQLAREAHTTEQYNALANYYEKRSKDYLQQAAEERHEWVRRSQNVMGLFAKYPRPVDSARYLYEYYFEKASEAGALSAKYSQLANPAAPATIQSHM